MSEKFSVGDVVVLKSGGPRMTVDTIGTALDPYMRVSWFDEDDRVYSSSFLSEMLVMASSKTPVMTSLSDTICVYREELSFARSFRK